MPTKLQYSTTITNVVYNSAYDDPLEFEVILLAGKLDCAYIHLTNYQQILRWLDNQKVKPRKFQKGDFVLRQVIQNKKVLGEGELGPTLEGPYIIES